MNLIKWVYKSMNYRSFFVIALMAAALMFIVAAGPASATGTWVPFASHGVPGKVPVIHAPMTSGAESLVVIQTPGMTVEPIYANGKTYQLLTLPGFSYINETGLPQLPAIRKMLAIPAKAATRVEVISAEYTVLPDSYLVWPAQPYTLETEPVAPFTIDEQFYAGDAAYPSTVATVSEPMIWRNLRVVTLDIHPIRYNPATRGVEVASSITIRIRHEGTDLTNSLAAEPTAVSPLLVPSYKSAVINFDSLNLPIQNQGTDAGIDYLIIADPDLIAAVQPLADYHTANGLSVSIVDVTTIGSSTTAIKDYITAEYNTASPADLDYVLFAGDIDVIPWYLWTGSESDSWYSCLAGTDVLAEIAIGRMPAKDAAAMTIVVDKTLAYLNGENNGAWQQSVSLLAHKENYPGKYTECSEQIRTYDYEYDPPTFDTIYGGESGSNQNVIDRTNQGRGIVNYRGHGSTTTWSSWDTSSASFTTTMAHSLTNGGMTPVVFSIACLNMSLYNSSESFAEAWFMQDQGAVAFLGATQPSYTIPNHDFDKFLFKAIYDKAITPIGYILNDANYDLITYGGHGDLAVSNVKMYLWLGDPALEVPVSALLAPTNLTGTPDGEVAVDLGWTDRADSEDGYYVESRIADGDWELLDTLAPNTEAYRNDGLTEGTHVSYRVQAFSAAMGESSYSNTVQTATLPAAPTDASVELIKTNQIYLAWADNSKGEDGYILERSSASSDTFIAFADLPTNSNSYTDSDLEECETYTYRVRAVNIGGSSDYSNTAIATTLPFGPTDLTAMALDDGRIELSWADNSSGEEGYRIMRAGNDGSELMPIDTVDADSNSVIDEGLDESASYVYRVCAVGIDGDSVPSNRAVATTLPAGPGALDGEAENETTISLTWEDNSSGENGFRIYRKLDGELSFQKIGVADADATSYQDSGMTEATKATYKVAAFSDAGKSADSNALTALTVPAAPQELMIFVLSSKKIELSWLDRSEGEDGYVIERMGSGGTWDELDRVGADVTGYINKDLKADKTYNYRVAAYNEGGLSTYSNEEEGKTSEDSSGDDDDDDLGNGCGAF